MLYGGGLYDGNFNIDPWMDSNGITRAYMLAGLHPNPVDILEIGLASGSWSRVMSSYGPVRHMTTIEINPGYLPLISKYPEQAKLLRDPRYDIHIDDGRRWLNRNPDRKFDFILQNTIFMGESVVSRMGEVSFPSRRAHCVAFRKVSKSASSCCVSTASIPAGISDTAPGRSSLMSARATRCSVSGPVASTTSSDASLRTIPE